MSQYSTFKPLSLTQLTRKSLLVKNIIGIDKSTDRNSVNPHRAIDSLNYYYKNGVVQKRSGYDEIAKFGCDYRFIETKFDGTQSEDEIEVKTDINSIHSFYGEDGKEHIVAHVGYLLFELKDFSSGRPSFYPILSDLGTTQISGVAFKHAYKFGDFRSSKSFFTGKSMLWFASGEKFVVIRAKSGSSYLVVEAVENNADITFVPVTMTNITATNAIVSSRNALDDPNMLNMWRKNKLISGIALDDTAQTKVPFYQYVLSTSIVCKDEKKDMADFEVTVQERGSN